MITSTEGTHMNRNELKSLVLNRTREVIDLAKELYGFPITFEELDITFPTAGKSSLATAGYRTYLGERRYSMTFKIEAIEQQLNDALYDSIPHEVAHLVNCALPRTGKNHDAGWKQVCVALGGSGNRTAKGLEVVLTPAKFQKKYLYEASCGTQHPVSGKRHKSVQLGAVLTMRQTKGRIDRTCFVREVSVAEQKAEIKRKQAELAAKQGRQVVDIPPAQKEEPAPPVRRAARSVGGKQTKAQGVQSYLQRNTFSCPAEAIAGIMQQFDMTKPGASTYYYKYK